MINPTRIPKNYLKKLYPGVDIWPFAILDLYSTFRKFRQGQIPARSEAQRRFSEDRFGCHSILKQFQMSTFVRVWQKYKWIKKICALNSFLLNSSKHIRSISRTGFPRGSGTCYWTCFSQFNSFLKFIYSRTQIRKCQTIWVKRRSGIESCLLVMSSSSLKRLFALFSSSFPTANRRAIDWWKVVS